MKFKFLFIISFPLALLVACGGGTNQTIDETPTRGKIKIAVDESFQLLIDTELYTFQSLYKYADITPVYTSEEEVINSFMRDSIRTIVTTKTLTKEQETFFNQRQIIPRTTKIAYDAVTIIINKSNPDSLIRYTDIKKIFSGTSTLWKEINPKSKLEKINVVFDNSKSSNTRYIREKFDITTQYPDNFYALNNNQEVIEYVERNKNALGIISVNWISDRDDSLSRGFLKKIQVCAISSPIAPDGPDFYKPYQGFIADNSYPFIRDVYMICKETFSGLGSGFTSFVAGDQGQRIVLKSGLVPATMPIRVIQIKKN